MSHVDLELPHTLVKYIFGLSKNAKKFENTSNKGYNLFTKVLNSMNFITLNPRAGASSTAIVKNNEVYQELIRYNTLLMIISLFIRKGNMFHHIREHIKGNIPLRTMLEILDAQCIKQSLKKITHISAADFNHLFVEGSVSIVIADFFLGFPIDPFGQTAGTNALITSLVGHDVDELQYHEDDPQSILEFLLRQETILWYQAKADKTIVQIN